MHGYRQLYRILGGYTWLRVVIRDVLSLERDVLSLECDVLSFERDVLILRT